MKKIIPTADKNFIPASARFSNKHMFVSPHVAQEELSVNLPTYSSLFCFKSLPADTLQSTAITPYYADW